MIEAGHIGHYGLLIRPQSAHDVYASPPRRQEERGHEEGRNKKRARERENEVTQSCMLVFPPHTEDAGTEHGEICVFLSLTASSSTDTWRSDVERSDGVRGREGKS